MTEKSLGKEIGEGLMEIWKFVEDKLDDHEQRILALEELDEKRRKIVRDRLGPKKEANK